MAGDWIKMRSNLWDDPRVAQLCDSTNTTEATVIGGLYWLWASADQHTTNGWMPGLTFRQINRKAGIKGFAEALSSIGWLREGDGGVTIVNFEEHNGESAKKRAADSKRKAGVRKTSADSRTDRGQSVDESRTNDGQKAPDRGAREREEKRREENLEGNPSQATPSRLELPADGVAAVEIIQRVVQTIFPDARIIPDDFAVSRWLVDINPDPWWIAAVFCEAELTAKVNPDPRYLAGMLRKASDEQRENGGRDYVEFRLRSARQRTESWLSTRRSA